ncbi:hypothetical protein [Streptomyces sp. NPDC002205]|uniref:hypothetical protein n=1 Tax=Streptomyces sp. NPDC002205 TaxID=3154411 RepID=UPI0033284987
MDQPAWKQGIIPAITSVATVDEAQLDVEEKRHIEEHIRKGHRLFNAPTTTSI